MPEELTGLNPENDDQSSENDLLVLGTESPNDGEEKSVRLTEVSPTDIFKLAKRILLVCVIVFLLVAAARIFSDKEHEAGVKEVWEYSKITLSSIVSLVLGLYFGKKSA